MDNKLDIPSMQNNIISMPHNNTIDYRNQYKSIPLKRDYEIPNQVPPIPTTVQSNPELDNLELKFDKSKPKVGRKRKFQNQSRNERKQRANSNQKYINAKGKEVMPKVFDAKFKCGCKKKCTERFTVDFRKNIFNLFWSLGSYEARCAFLSGYVSQSIKSKCYTHNESKRVYTRKYFFDDLEVCKKAFLKTFQICQSRIDVVLKKKEAASFQDLRGKASGGNNKMPEEVVNKIIHHINSFPKYSNHYCKHKNKSKYLNPDLNLTVMYELYKSKYANEIPMPSLSTYKKIFYEKFDLKFKPGKGSSCKTCEMNARKAAAEAELKKDREKKEEMMKRDSVPVAMLKPQMPQYFS